MLQLQAYNPEINWETREVKITRCPPLYKRTIQKRGDKKVEKGKRVVILKKEKIVKQIVNDKEDWRREKEIEVNYRKIEEIVLKKFLKQKKVFGKVEPERMPTRKIWDHIIDLKEMFKLWKERIYSLSKNKREKCHKMTFLLWNDIELSWKLHLLEYLFQIFIYKYGIVDTF